MREWKDSHVQKKLYLPRPAIRVSIIAAARKINTKIVATRLAELSSLV
jgi:hypothetical protein